MDIKCKNFLNLNFKKALYYINTDDDYTLWLIHWMLSIQIDGIIIVLVQLLIIK